jgi:hypothetical protein
MVLFGAPKGTGRYRERHGVVVAYSLRTAQIHRQFIAIHKMEGAKTRRNTRGNNRFTFCFEEGKEVGLREAPIDQYYCISS